MLWNATEASAAAAPAAHTRRSARARPRPRQGAIDRAAGRSSRSRRRQPGRIRIGLVFRRHRTGRRDAEPDVIAELAAAAESDRKATIAQANQHSAGTSRFAILP